MGEHVMLVDLGRNDVGRVSQMGTVKVEKLMEIERFTRHAYFVHGDWKADRRLESLGCVARSFTRRYRFWCTESSSDANHRRFGSIQAWTVRRRHWLRRFRRRDGYRVGAANDGRSDETKERRRVDDPRPSRSWYRRGFKSRERVPRNGEQIRRAWTKYRFSGTRVFEKEVGR